LEKNIEIVREKGNLMKELLKLGYSPIGISLGKNPPSSLPKLGGKMEFCKMWKAAFKGESFYTMPNNHNCLTGQYYLGLREWKESVCRFLVDKVHAFGSQEIVNRYLEKVPILMSNESKVICISPLENITFIPDIVLVRCNPEQAMLLLWPYSYNTGDTVNGETGTAMCTSLVIKPYLNKKPSFSIGDPGGRYIVGLSGHEIVASIPLQHFNNMIETLQSHLEDWRGQE